LKTKGSTIIDIYFPDDKSKDRRKGIFATRRDDEILGKRRSSPNPVAGVICCGFECGVAGAVDSAIMSAHFNSNPDAETTSTSTAIARNGGRSLRLNPTNKRARVHVKQNWNQTVQIGRVYVYFASLPTGNTGIVHTGEAFPNAVLGIGYHASTGTLRTFWGNILTDARFASSGISVTTGQWYLIDYRFDNTVGAKTADGRVDGVALAQKTSANADDYIDSIYLGSMAANATFDIYFDDFFAHPDETLYPLGAGYTKAYIPSADGAHNTQSCFSIADAETGSYTLIDDLPMDAGFTTPANSIIQSTSNTAAYVEHLFSPVGGAPSGNPRAVDILVSCYASDGAPANISTGFWKMILGGKEKASFGQSFFTGDDTSVTFRYQSYVNGGGFTWTLDKLNNLKLRFGYSPDADPDFHYDGAVIEAEFAE
jgi:hypothetical protein